MRHLSFCILSCVLLLFSFAQAQDPGMDSLKKVAASLVDEDTSKVNTLIALSSQHLNTDLKEAIRYGSEALAISERIGFKKGEGYSYKAMGLGYFVQANYTEAAVQFQRSLEVFEAIGLKAGIANILSNLGATYFNAGDDEKAIDFQLRALRIAEEINDKIRIGTTLNNIGSTYNNK